MDRKKLEKSRSRLKILVEQGVPYDSDKMRTALEECISLDALWKQKEQEYLKLKESV